jgi:hypothetical protein
MVRYELREQHIFVEECDPPGRRWHIVESGRQRALCGRTVDTAAVARPVAELADIAPGCFCDPCEQIRRGAAGRPLSGDWHEDD